MHKTVPIETLYLISYIIQGRTQFYSPIAETNCLGTINGDQEYFSTLNDLNAGELDNTVPVTWEHLESLFNDTIEEDTESNNTEHDLYESTSECVDCNTDPELIFGHKDNEYDFVNSLLDYKKGANDSDHRFSVYLPLDSSLSFSSPTSVYSAFNRCKYQPTLTDTLIKMIEFSFEETLMTLSTQYGAIFPHLLYSLLKGRPVICIARYCDDLAYLKTIIDTLSHFIPNSNHTLNSLFSRYA